MGFLIPTAQPNPGLLGRFGRLVHWTGLGLATLMLVPAYFAVTQLTSAPIQPVSAQMSQANPFDRFDAPSTSVGSNGMSVTPANGPWTQYASKAPQTENGFTVVSPNQPTSGVGVPPGRDTLTRITDPWAAFDGVAPSVQQTPVTSTPLNIHQQGLPYEFWLIVAVVLALVGRAARYLFAGE